jgi:ATP-dependent phosphofructokinase / diphosphate-dependent phosphofructokinase
VARSLTYKRIGILTGGGDVPGLNTVIKSVVYRGAKHECEVVGIRRGWQGLTHVNLDDPVSTARYIMPLTTDNTRTIDRSGGTFLHSSRTNPQRMKDLPDFLKGTIFPTSQSTEGEVTTIVTDVSSHVIKNIERLKLDHLITIGGDDTLSFAAKLHEQGVKLIAVPKTMDNDVRNTEYCIGFSTAITRAMDAIQRQRTTVASHERIGLFRVFGRSSGYTALYTAYVTGIRCAIPEYRFNLEKLIDLLLRDKRENPSNYCLFVMSESAEWEGYQLREYGKADAYGHRKRANVAHDLSDEIEKRNGEETVVSDLTYDLRSGEPDFTDRLVSTAFGNIAFDAVLAGKRGMMTAIVGGSYALVEIPDPRLGPRKVDIETMYNKERMRPNYSNKIGLPIFLIRA